MWAVARASCTALCAFLRLMPSDLQTAPSLWLLRLGYILRENSSVSMTGMWISIPSRLHSSVRKDIVKFCVVRRKRRPADKFQQFRDFDFRRVRVGDHGVGDVR